MKKHIPLLLSTLGALFLFASPSKIMLLLEAAVFLAVVLSLRTGAEAVGDGFRGAAFAAALIFTFIGVHHCAATLLKLALPRVLAALAPIVSGLAAFYALYRLACQMDSLLCRLLGTSVDAPGNWKSNCFLPLSALAFFFLEARSAWTVEYGYSVLAALGIALLTACRAPALFRWCRRDGWPWRVFYGLTTLGICWFQGEAYAAAGGVPVLGVLCGAASFFFVYPCVSGLYRALGRSLKGIFSHVFAGEWILYGALALAVLGFVTVTFLKTDIFYGTPYPYDIVYTSDSHKLLQENAYLWLTCGENDLRQPLFAVFAAPFTGCAWLISHVLSLNPAWHALLMNLPQVLLLLLANFLLANLLKLTSRRRAFFLLLSCTTYPFLLFSLMMEQYLIAYFYFVWLLHSLCAEKQNSLAYCGAAGTLLTSAVTLPFLSQRHPIRGFSLWFRDMVHAALTFVIAILAFGRLEVLLNAADNFLSLNRFSGESLSFVQRLYQYTAFIPGCLVSPAAEVCENMWGNLSWQLTQRDSIQWAGLILLAVCVVSAVWNRDKKSSVLAGLWVGFSFLVLCVLGWGTQENGLILYALYFGWAFLVLLYQLAEKLEETLRLPHLTEAVSVATMVLFAAVNFPAMAELLRFALENYPL